MKIKGVEYFLKLGYERKGKAGINYRKRILNLLV